MWSGKIVIFGQASRISIRNFCGNPIFSIPTGRPLHLFKTVPYWYTLCLNAPVRPTTHTCHHHSGCNKVTTRGGGEATSASRREAICLVSLRVKTPFIFYFHGCVSEGCFIMWKVSIAELVIDEGFAPVRAAYCFIVLCPWLVGFMLLCCPLYINP